MVLVHFKGPYAMKTACGRTWKQASATSERPDQVTCPKCKEALTRSREANKDLGNYTIKDDMVGTARIRRSEGKKLRVTMGMVRQLIREAEGIEKPMAELEKLIAALGPDEPAPEDYIDSETGEFYLEKGHKARTSALHPQHVIDMQARTAADREARRLEDEQWAKEDAEWEAEQDRSRQEAQTAFDAAVREYAGNWTDWRQSMGDEEVEEQSVAMDAALGFFHQFPDWKRWAAELGMKKADIQSMVADFVYEAIITGRTDF